MNGGPRDRFGMTTLAATQCPRWVASGPDTLGVSCADELGSCVPHELGVALVANGFGGTCTHFEKPNQFSDAN